eukprot:GILI01009840.1.p1 GENE.GILI01009840.1~~GILI01009840.1.p1  ORF type:complete len:176 (+),score=34.90 GILI01009840.1:95-622(+)
MGRGFGRGAKTVSIVTHAQVKGRHKIPRGLRGNRKKKRRQFQNANDEQAQLETSMGVGAQPNTKNTKPNETGILNGRRTMAQEIASIQFEHNIRGRKKGFKQLRKQLLDSVKDLRRKHHEKAQKLNARGARISGKKAMAFQYEQELAKSRGSKATAAGASDSESDGEDSDNVSDE